MALVLLAGLLGGCGSSGGSREPGGLAGDLDGANIPDAVPRVEPLSKYGNPDTYVVGGKRYHPRRSSAGHVERGLASWYGKKFHGRKTSSGERYNMYAMTAAHKTLPLPTYARVTNLENGRSAVVKVNDRGPFHSPRVIDLSYSAAKKLGVVQKGTAMVEVRAIDPSRPGSDTGPVLAANAAGAKPRTVEPSDPKLTERELVRRDSPPSIATATPSSTAVGTPASAPAPTQAATLAQHDGDAIRERALDAALAASGAEPVAKSKAGPSGQGIYLQVGAFGDPRNAERLRERLVSELAEQVRVQSSAASGPRLYKVRVGPLTSEGEARRVSARLVTLGVSEPRRVWN